MKKMWRAVVCLALVMMVAFGSCAYAANVKILNVTVNGARVRDSNGEVIGSAGRNLKVFYMGKKIRSNSLVRCANGKAGYIYDGFLELYGSVDSDSIYYCNVKSSKIYRSPSTSASGLGYMYKDQYVILMRTQGDWAYVRNLSGAGGFCKLSHLNKAD